jgi:hypothetical protein
MDGKLVKRLVKRPSSLSMLHLFIQDIAIEEFPAEADQSDTERDINLSHITLDIPKGSIMPYNDHESIAGE